MENGENKNDSNFWRIIAVIILILSFFISGVIFLSSALAHGEGFASLGAYYDKFIVYVFLFTGVFTILGLIVYSNKKTIGKNLIKVSSVLFVIGVLLILSGDIFGIEESEFGCIIETKWPNEKDCYTNLAIRKGDSSFCDRLDELDIPDCYTDFVSKAEDSWLCEKVSKQSSRFAECYSNIALATGDISWCEKVKEISYYGENNPANARFYQGCLDLFDS